MKLILIVMALFAFNGFAGVGGSVGGGRDKNDSSNRDLDFYLDQGMFKTEIPNIKFKNNGARVFVPVNEICVRDEDALESKFEQKLKHYDENRVLMYESNEIVSQPRTHDNTYRVEILKFRAGKVADWLPFATIDYSIEACR